MTVQNVRAVARADSGLGLVTLSLQTQHCSGVLGRLVEVGEVLWVYLMLSVKRVTRSGSCSLGTAIMLTMVEKLGTLLCSG